MEHEVDIRTGRREVDGHLHVSIFMEDMIALALEGYGERAPTLLLTLEQARKLQSALAELIPLIEKATTREELEEPWSGDERRSLAR